jgi:hypothetical protein
MPSYLLKTFSSKGKAMIQTLAKAENQYLVKRAVTCMYTLAFTSGGGLKSNSFIFLVK